MRGIYASSTCNGDEAVEWYVPSRQHEELATYRQPVLRARIHQLHLHSSRSLSSQYFDNQILLPHGS